MSNVSVNFKVSGNELSNYIDVIKRKSDELTSSAITGAIEQTKRGKEQLRIIEDQIRATEKKTRMELDAVRATSTRVRDEKIGTTGKYYKEERIKIQEGMNDGSISAVRGDARIAYTERRQKEDEQSIIAQHKETITAAKEASTQAKMQTNLSRENIDTLKQTAKDNIKAIIAGDLKLSDVISSASTDEQKFVANLTKEGLVEEKKLSDKESKGEGKGLIGGLLAIDNLNKIIGSAGQLGQTQNGFDIIQPASNMAGRVIGGIIGGLVGTLAGGVGAIAGAGVGSELGGGFGDVFGAAMKREAMTKQDYFKAANRYNAVTGKDKESVLNMEDSGISAIDFTQMQTETARRRGSASDSAKSTTDAIYLDKGYGVDQGTSGAIMEMQRSSKENNRDLASLIGGVLQKGEGSIFKNGDHTFLNEFLGKFVTLQKELLKNQTNVASGTTMDILSKFDSIGGEFSARDSRSSGNISAIQNGLSNPGSDNLKALSFAVLRRQMPGASIFDILEERKRGLGSPAYLKGMLEAVDHLGGDDSQKMLNMQNVFPGLSASATRRLYQNRGSLMSGNISLDELKSKYKDDWKEKSEGNTTDMEKNTALVTNGILGGRDAQVMMDAFVTAVKDGLGGSVITLNNGQGTITLGKQAGATRPKNTMKDSHITTLDVLTPFMGMIPGL